MVNLKSNKSVAIFLVVVTIIVVLVLATFLLNVMTNQSRLTHHQISRIQAFYACKAGINYTLDKLRLGTSTGGWNTASCPSPGGCTYTDSDFPSSISSKQVVITIIPSGQPGCLTPPAGSIACISASTTYTYTSS
jgi:hypothetical protein